MAGTWKDLTDNVNSMAGNLTGQVRNIADVTTAVANGDLSKKITVDVKGEILELKNTINTMVDQLSSFAAEVTRVAREVGTEGKLGGQADVSGVAGTWKDLTDSVNSMAGNLTGQVRNIAEVTTAVANGDLSKKITVDVKGEILELKNTINTMVDQLRSFAAEVTRVAREVGTEGKLGGQADVRGVAGTWKDLTDNVNSMAGNLTAQVRNIAEVTTAVANGDLSKKITVDVKGEILELKNTINTMVDQLSSFAAEVTRVAREVGTEGKLGGQADVRGVAGTWKDLTDNVNFMAGNLTAQVRNIAEVTTAVANGRPVEEDHGRREGRDPRAEGHHQHDGGSAQLLRGRSDARGARGGHRRQARRPGRGAGRRRHLEGPHRQRQLHGAQPHQPGARIAKVVTAVANGDLKRKLAVEAKGEIAALADTINGMIDTLATFADQVTTVAREVGVEGKLGGQAKVPGAAGTWKDLTDNVNQLAANLTTQVRAIAEVATAVTKGDLTRSITVEAQGEVAALKDNINEMIRNLKDTTQKNSEQDWLKTNLAKFTRMLQGQRDLLTVGKLILSELAPVVSAQQALFYTMDGRQGGRLAAAARELRRTTSKRRSSDRFRLGEGLVGQCALEKERILLTRRAGRLPPDLLRPRRGGAADHRRPAVLFEGEVKAVLELASFEHFSPTHLAFLDQLIESIGIVLNTIEANMRTEDLLKQSQSLADELQSQQEELQQTNQELEEKAKLLAEQNVEVERKNTEVEQARQALEEKAEQLALTSKYKSEFLANMSHELRTPLNSLLILSDQLSRNPEGNLTGKQTEFAQTIHAAGNDLLTLINDILDLSKIESGTVAVDIERVRVRTTCATTSSARSGTSPRRRSSTSSSTSPRRCRRAIQTDPKRLQQVLKNLLSNAFKFTERGPRGAADRAGDGGLEHRRSRRSSRARSVIAFSVTDTGIGIPEDKQQIIFEAFQQADGSTSRKYGGTGLGLAISREIARLLGGEICVSSMVNHGSTFTLYLPQEHAARRKPAVVPDRARHDARAPAEEVGAARRRCPSSWTRRPTTATAIQPGDRVAADRRERRRFAQFLLDTAREHGFKGVVTAFGAAALARARGASAGRDHARPPAARHRRLAGPGPPEERPRHPPHPGLRDQHRGGAGALPGARRRWTCSPSRCKDKESLERMLAGAAAAHRAVREAAAGRRDRTVSSARPLVRLRRARRRRPSRRGSRGKKRSTRSGSGARVRLPGRRRPVPPAARRPPRRRPGGLPARLPFGRVRHGAGTPIPRRTSSAGSRTSTR